MTRRAGGKPHLRLHIVRFKTNPDELWWKVTKLMRDGQEAGGMLVYASSAEAIRRAPR